MRALKQPTLISQFGFILRPWRLSDADAVVTAFSDKEIQRWHRLSVESRKEAERWIDNWAVLWLAESSASWAVTDHDSVDVLGQVGLRHINLGAGRVDCSYWTLPAARGRGVASAATLSVAAWLSGSLGMHRLELTHSVANSASCQVARKCGFRYEGELRSRLRLADGWHDVHLHALVFDD